MRTIKAIRLQGVVALLITNQWMPYQQTFSKPQIMINAWHWSPSFDNASMDVMSKVMP